ncbi:uncharacterized protein LTHEOB_10298 [Lasiodiplodia theobromae]|uniref:uncharacterized protein n=1 Tax=Lasiodiplodia theobromae TaxID=45133 RepID=UPI0015C3F4EA|nr:uncharacterized protein LTHEOB_10298 [Lasiodiplodia theobromae]KAF4539366.1 hypothetical protein LTHEOB_10298 [Lasiodiplodia theobromae]
MKSRPCDTSAPSKRNAEPAAGQTEPSLDICHLLLLPRELRDLIWEYSLLSTHTPPAQSSPPRITSDYRQYDSWGEEASYYPRRTRVNSTTLLCCSRQINAEVSDAIDRLRAQRRLTCSLRILLRNEQYLFIDWLCVPAVATHYDAVHIDFKTVGKPQPIGSGSLRGLPIKTVHPSALPGHPSQNPNASSSSISRTRGASWSSLLYEPKDRDFSFHRHLFKLLARLRNYGPSFLGDPVIFSAITTPSSGGSTFSSSSTPPSSSRCRAPTPTTFTTLTINVLTPPSSHTDPSAFRPPLYPWLICGGRDETNFRQRWLAVVRRYQRECSSSSSSSNFPGGGGGGGTGMLVPPAVVAACCREFFAWAMHARSTAGAGASGIGVGKGQNAFLKDGFGDVRVLLDGREDLGLESGGEPEMMRAPGPGPGPGQSRGRSWWEPVFKDEAEAFACDGGEGLHRYCKVTRELRRRG